MIIILRYYIHKINNAAISKEPSGKYYVSLCCTDIEINKLVKLQRELSRKSKGSSNRNKARLKE